MNKMQMLRVPQLSKTGYPAADFGEDWVMPDNALDAFTHSVRADWGPLSTELIGACAQHMAWLAQASEEEPWLAALHREAPASKELHRDPDHGFMLLAHSEPAGLYRPPHDHGRSWVIYAVQHGAIEMGTYACVKGCDASPRLVKRNATLVTPGMVQVYLPGDIHDTRCVHGPALLFRFTERDLRREDREAGTLTRYAERNGLWTVAA